MHDSSAPLTRVNAWPSWPQYDHRDLRELERVLESLEWGGVDASAVREFERRWADYLDVGFARTCSNGTISLVMALQALGIGRGDEVIVPAYTFYATATSVLTANAVPVFVDVDARTGNLNLSAVEAAITPRTKAVVAVHFAGLAVDLTALGALCRRHNLQLVEDAAHAHGTEWEGKRVGASGSLVSWSFQSSKNLTAGEGGALTTNDPALAEHVDSLRNCGRVPSGAWYEHHVLGANHRMTAIQAALLVGALHRYPAQFERRTLNASILTSELSDCAHVEAQVVDPRVTAHAYHLYAFRYRGRGDDANERDDFVGALQDKGIPATAGYPMPLNEQPVFRRFRFDRNAVGWDALTSQHYDEVLLPGATRLCAQAVWIPHRVLLADPERVRELAQVIKTTRVR